MDAKEIRPFRTRELEDFEELKFFTINPETFARVKRHMAVQGYDPSQPINIWNGKVVDGRIRRSSALELGIEEIPGCEMGFVDEEEALEYAIHNQVDRRNLSEQELFNLVVELDKKNRQKVGRPKSSAPLVKRHLFDDPPNPPVDDRPKSGTDDMWDMIRELKVRKQKRQAEEEEKTYGRSSTKTGQMVNISGAMVERIRAINGRAQVDLESSKIFQAFQRREISLNRAYDEIMKKSESKSPKLEFEGYSREKISVTIKKGQAEVVRAVDWMILGKKGEEIPELKKLWGGVLWFRRLTPDPNETQERFRREREKVDKRHREVEFSTA